MRNIRSSAKKVAFASLVAGGITMAAAPGAFASTNQINLSVANGTNSTAFQLQPLTNACPVATSAGTGELVESFVLDNSLFPVSSLQNLVYTNSSQSWTLGSNTAYSFLTTASGGHPEINLATDPSTGTLAGAASAAVSFQNYLTTSDYNPSPSTAQANGIDLYPGTWNIGYACTNAGHIDSTIVYEQVTITDTTPTGSSNYSFSWTTQSSQTPEFPFAAAVPAAAIGILGGGLLFLRRRNRSAAAAA
jgi:hypothetical protein